MGIMRAFVAVRQMVALPKTDKLTELPVSYTHLDVYKRQSLQMVTRMI